MSTREHAVDEEHDPRRAAWILLAGWGVLTVAVALGLIVKGRPFDRYPFETLARRSFDDISVIEPKVFDLVSALFRILGGSALVAGALVTTIASTSFRRGRTWAWCVMWLLPLESAIEFATFAGYGALTPTQVIWDLTRFAAAALALALSFRGFFPERARPRRHLLRRS